MKYILTILLSITLFILSGCDDKKTIENKKEQTSTKTQEKNEVQKEENIVLTDIQGDAIEVLSPKENQFIFKGYENKILMVNFFTTWCPPCKAEIPHLNNLQHKYKDDLKIVGVLLEEEKTNNEIMSFINDNKVEFTITNSPSNFVLAEKMGGVKSIPFMLVYDKNGEYFQHYVGAVPEEMMDADIQKILK